MLVFVCNVLVRAQGDVFWVCFSLKRQLAHPTGEGGLNIPGEYEMRPVIYLVKSYACSRVQRK